MKGNMTTAIVTEDSTERRQRVSSATLWVLAFARYYGKLRSPLFFVISFRRCVHDAAWSLGQLIKGFQIQDKESSLMQLGALFIALEILAVAAQYLGRMRLAYVTTDIITRIRAALFQKTADLPIAYLFDRQPIGRILTRMNG